VSDSIDTRVREIVADILRVPLNDLGLSSSSTTVARWDSLNHMKLILALEEEFGISFSEEQIAGTTSLPALLGEVQKMARA
jgi:acyl carrier protein